MASKYNDEVDRIPVPDSRAIDIIGHTEPEGQHKTKVPEIDFYLEDDEDGFIHVNKNVSRSESADRQPKSADRQSKSADHQPKSAVHQEWATVDHPHIWRQIERLQNLSLVDEKLPGDSEKCFTLLFLTSSFSDKDLKRLTVELFFKRNQYRRLNGCYSYGCINDKTSEHTCILACDEVPLHIFPMLKDKEYQIKISL